MKRSYAVAGAIALLIAMLALPLTATAFQITGGGGNQTQNPYGYWYAGKEACAQEGCHKSIAAQPSPHSEMVKDITANPEKLIPAADSGLWPFTSPLGGITVRPRDIYLQVGDGEGLLEYIGPAGSTLATKVVPADDLPMWSPMSFEIEKDEWDVPTAKIANSVYAQSCGGCHNVGLTRPSNATTTLPSGAIQSTSTPTTVSELGIQCESCHGSGKNPNGHKNGVPGVVGGYQILKAQVCGQCHVTATAPQKNVAGAAFGNPNGFTTDATLSAYLTPSTVVETEGAFMNYINGVTTVKPKFLPNGDNYSMRHVYYNEWLVNKVPSHAGGDHGHADPVNESVKTQAAAGETRCLKCHSGLGFLNRIDAKAPTGTRLVPTFPAIALVTTADPGISCMVCHTGHIAFKEGGGYDSARRWGNGKEVSCGDCHNWQFEMLGQDVQRETIAGVEYTRPAANLNSRHPQREMVSGGLGGEDGLGGMWGVAPVGAGMPGITCKDCHMPRTSKEGMPANDDGTDEATRMSHRFHPTLPGDAARWKLRPNGDSCAPSCHKDEVAGYSRADFQAWIDQKTSAVATASAAATGTLDEVAIGMGLSASSAFLKAQPATGTAGSLTAAKWAMLQHAAQNVDFVTGDASGGIHNPAYALAGLAKAAQWAHSASASLNATLGTGPAIGGGMDVTGSLLGVGAAPIFGAEVVLETSTNGGSSWSTVQTRKPNTSGDFTIPTGPIVGNRIFRVRYSPSAGVDYLSQLMPVAVPVTTATVIPASAGTGWINAASAQVTMSATPGSLTFYTLSGATVTPKALYLEGVTNLTIANQGETDVNFWSTDGGGAEATQTQPVHLDRGNPSVYSDVKAVYGNKATVHVWGMDSGAGVGSMRYTFGASTRDISGSSFTFESYTLGRHDLVVRATDGAGKSTYRTFSVWMKAKPKLTMSPSIKKTISHGSSITFSTRATRGKDGAGKDIMFAGRPIVLQRWNGSAWVTWTKLSSGSGTVKLAKRFATKGTSYWRWYVPADSCSFAASSPFVTIVVK